MNYQESTILGLRKKSDILKYAQSSNHADFSYMGLNHIIKYLNVSPSSQDIEILNRIWSQSKDFEKEILQYNLCKSEYGRGLYVAYLPEKEAFDMLLKIGTNQDLRRFLDNHSNYFKDNALDREHSSYYHLNKEKNPFMYRCRIRPKPSRYSQGYFVPWQISCG